MKGVLAPTVKFGIFVLVTVLATGSLAFMIADVDLNLTTTYRAVFTDVTSLNPGDDVRIAGVKVGAVSGVQIVNRREAEVTFTVDASHRLPASVTAAIKFRNLVGQRYLELDQGPGDLNATLSPGGTIPVDHTQPALNLTALFNGFQPLFQALNPADVNQLSYEIIQVLQGEGGTIDDLLAHVASLTTTIAGRDQVIGQVIDNLNSVLGTVNQRDGELSDLITTLQQLVSGLAVDRQPIGDAITALGALTNATAGLLDQARAPLQADIANLGVLAGNLDSDQGDVQSFVQGLPGKVEAITRTASYGSWFNFYLCRLSGTVGVSSLNLNATILPLPASDMPARCQ